MGKKNSEINKTQPRALVKSGPKNIRLGDLYFSMERHYKYDDPPGIVICIKREGFWCLYNSVYQDTQELRRVMIDKVYRERQATPHFMDTEEGFFLRRQDDGRLEIVAATNQFLTSLEILEERYQNFLEKLEKPSNNPFDLTFHRPMKG